MGEPEQHVRLELVASVELDAQRVMRFIQELKDIPSDAWCEVQTLWSKQSRATSQRVPTSNTITTVQMQCDHRVADFLCQRFSSQTRHISQGELLLVRCSRMHMRNLPVSKSRHSTSPREDSSSSTQITPAPWPKTDVTRPLALSRSTVADLLDCLGDHIADVLDAFKDHAQSGEGAAKLSLIGLVQAIESLRDRNGDRPGGRKNSKDATADRAAVHSIRHLLAQMVVHGAVSIQSLPEANHHPFLSYTDFIAVYTASRSISIDTPASAHRNAAKTQETTRRKERT